MTFINKKNCMTRYKKNCMTRYKYLYFVHLRHCILKKFEISFLYNTSVCTKILIFIKKH